MDEQEKRELQLHVLLLQRALKFYQEEVNDPEGKYTEHILYIMAEIHEALEKLKEK